jgi:AP-4 complex subunit sigma-1
MFNLEKAHFIVDEMVIGGHIVETNKARILKPVRLFDNPAEKESSSKVMAW